MMLSTDCASQCMSYVVQSTSCYANNAKQL